MDTTPCEEYMGEVQFGIPHRLAESTCKEDYYKYYEPRVISIGPFHYGKPHLAPMENLKRKAVRELLFRRTFYKNFSDTMGAIEESYKSVERDLLIIRDCYNVSRWHSIPDSEWCHMMFCDGCFIIDFIVSERSCIKIMKKRYRDLVWHDLLLIENQLPFLVLTVLVNTLKCEEFNFALSYMSLHRMSLLTKSGHSVPPKLDDYITKVVRHPWKAPEPVHLLQYYRDLWFKILLGDDVAKDKNSKKKSEEEDNNKEEDHFAVCSAFSVTELKKVGIRCSCAGNLMNFSPRDIHLKSSMLSGKLFLPQLIIDEWTMTNFYNLVAYEYSCSLWDRSFGITSYLSFMSLLINGEEDVKELRARGVVQLNLKVGDDKMVNFLRDITAHREPNTQDYITSHREPNTQDFKDVKQQISTYFRSKRLPLRVAYAEFKQRYFSGPWSFLVFLAVIFTVSMTVIQTVLTGIQTYK